MGINLATDPTRQHLSISLLEGTKFIEDTPCYLCGYEFTPDEDAWIVGLSLPKQGTIYLHDLTCFTELLQGLKQFDLYREQWREDSPALLN